MTDSYQNSPGDEWVSKTQRKKDMSDLQALGAELTALSSDTLKKMKLPEDLLAALLDYKRISAHGALKRQEQYIGKLMRAVDPEPIRQFLAILKGESNEHNAWLHRVERWRERLMAEDSTLQQFLAEHPDADVQQLRTLIRNGRKELQENKAPKNFRVLFQEIKRLIPEPGKPRNEEAYREDDEE
jgi:ribosome-associated protein